MKRNGFTLIELLAVIVILAIIALIATPIVLNIINNAKTSSNERSGELYIKAVENAIMKKQMSGTNTIEAGTYTVQSDGSICIVSNNACESGTTITIDVEGDVPTEGTLTVSNGVVVSYNLVVSGTNVLKGENSDEDENVDENTLSCLVGEASGITIYFIENNNKTYFNLNDQWYYSELWEDTPDDDFYRLIDFKDNIAEFDESKILEIYGAIGSLTLYKYDDTWYYYVSSDNIPTFTTGTIDKSIVESSIEFILEE